MCISKQCILTLCKLYFMCSNLLFWLSILRFIHINEFNAVNIREFIHSFGILFEFQIMWLWPFFFTRLLVQMYETLCTIYIHAQKWKWFGHKCIHIHIISLPGNNCFPKWLYWSDNSYQHCSITLSICGISDVKFW